MVHGTKEKTPAVIFGRSRQMTRQLVMECKQHSVLEAWCTLSLPLRHYVAARMARGKSTGLGNTIQTETSDKIIEN